MTRLHRKEIIRLLDGALGEAKATELIISTATELEMQTFDFSLEEAKALFNALTQHEGIVGITATFARLRLPALYRDAGATTTE